MTINDSDFTEERSRLFQTIYPALQEFCIHTLGWQTCPADRFRDLWLPLALQIRNWQQQVWEQAQRPLIQGILGGQGTGKTTLATILTQILNILGLQVCQISIDDLYKTYDDRQRLQQIDPRFCWRGPPGTHDIDLGIAVLQRLRQSQPVEVPRFDKSAHGGMGDRALPESVVKADIVFLEGWFVGVRPVDPIAFDKAPPPIVTAADRAFAREVNDRLRDYLPLWDLLDRLIVLAPTDYRYSKQWRREAEHQMMATGKPGMSDAEIDRFVEYFWRSLHPELFITPLLGEASPADYVIEINLDHCPIRLYRPSQSASPAD